ncbi:hypothetical protein MMC30_006869 [Trapelia coarctata]|nr:hypothetical protein [Trapelia coarctata]
MSQGSIGRKRSRADIDTFDDLKLDIEAIDDPSIQLLAELHDGKRSRMSQGPLEGAADNDKTRSKSSRSSKKSPSPPRQRLRSKWSSRFLEGSMNDRPSNKPPSIYIGDEHLVEQYIADQESGDGMTPSDANAPYDAGIQSNRPSSMYRFGKAIVNAFNPVMVWQGIHEMWKDKSEDESNPEEPHPQHRRVKAEEAYAALKRIGYPGTKGASTLELYSVHEDRDAASQLRPDSGIDVDGYRPSKERKRESIVFDNEEALRSTLSSIGNRETSGSESNSRSSIRLNKPAFSTLRKVKSNFQLPSSKRNSAILVPMTPDETDTPKVGTEHNNLKKQVFKKDLHKQQKLTKKVSDLESQLEKARRELHMSMELAPPIPPIPTLSSISKPRAFVPGALGSLPSERLLNGYLGPHSTPLPDPNTAEIEKVLGFPEADMNIVGLKKSDILSPAPKTDQNHTGQAKRHGTGKKRKSGDAVNRIHLPSADEEDLYSTEETYERRNRARSSKLQKTKQESSPASKPSQKENISPEKAVVPTSKDRTVSTSSTEGLSFDPAKVDQAKILAMRSNPKSTVPFGKLSDDIINLKKEYPGITNDQMVKYISFILDGEKKHPSRRASMQFNATKAKTAMEPRQPPALGRPRSASPSKKFPGGSLSPLPSLDYSKKPETTLRNIGGVAGDEVVTISPTKDKTVPPVPKVPKELEGQKAKVFGEVVQKEDFQWDDDVF